mgnify:CR=1 FL=1
MKRIVEQNLAEIIVVSVIVFAMSSCGTSQCMQNKWANPLSKQYSCSK